LGLPRCYRDLQSHLQHLLRRLAGCLEVLTTLLQQLQLHLLRELLQGVVWHRHELCPCLLGQVGPHRGLQHHLWGLQHHLWGLQHHLWGLQHPLAGLQDHLWERQGLLLRGLLWSQWGKQSSSLTLSHLRWKDGCRCAITLSITEQKYVSCHRHAARTQQAMTGTSMFLKPYV
jgi:hypothetical protein